MARAISMGRREVLAFAREAVSLPRRIDLNRIAVRRIASDRTLHAVLALTQLTLAVSTAMSDTIGSFTAAGACLSAAGVAFMMLLRTGEAVSTGARPCDTVETRARHTAATTRPHSPEATGREISGLLAMMNHELRTPLNAIVGNADAIRLDAFGPVGTARYRECAAHIREGGQALLRATEDMLALTSAIAAATFATHQPVDIEDMVREVLREASPAAKSRRIELSWQSAGVRPVLSETTALRQGIARAIEAALAHATPGASIHVELAPDRGNVELLVTLSQGDEHGFTEGARVDVGADRSPAALQLAVARTLFALLGTHLHAAHGIDGRWRAIVDLPAVTAH